jgi:hypothetical protein
MSARKVNWALLSTLAFLAVAPASADEPPPSYRRHHYGHRIYLPPERHVIEVVQPPWSGNFIINGRHFTGRSPACFGWAAGERIRLIEGDWNGRCVEAVFYNITRHSTCVTICGWSKFDRWSWW